MLDKQKILGQLKEAKTLEEVLDIKSSLPKMNYKNPAWGDYLSISGSITMKTRFLKMTDEDRVKWNKHLDKISKARSNAIKASKSL